MCSTGRSMLELLRHFWLSSQKELFWKEIKKCLRFRYFYFRLKFEPISYAVNDHLVLSKNCTENNLFFFFHFNWNIIPQQGDFPPSAVVLSAYPIDQISHCQKMIHELRHERHNRMLPVPRPLSKQPDK